MHNSLAYAPDNKTFISGSRDGTVREWNRDTGKCVCAYNGHQNWVTSVAYLPDGDKIVSGSHDGTIRIWSTETNECLQIIRNYPGLFIIGCDMRNLHEDSSIDTDILEQYGAIV